MRGRLFARSQRRQYTTRRRLETRQAGHALYEEVGGLIGINKSYKSPLSDGLHILTLGFSFRD